MQMQRPCWTLNPAIHSLESGRCKLTCVRTVTQPGILIIKPIFIGNHVRICQIMKRVCIIEWWCKSFMKLELVSQALTHKFKSVFGAHKHLLPGTPLYEVKACPKYSSSSLHRRQLSLVQVLLCVSFPTLVSKMKRGSCCVSAVQPGTASFPWDLMNRTCFKYRGSL